MTIEYALSRAEVVRSFLMSLKGSARYRTTILVYTVAMGLIGVITSGGLSQPFGVHVLYEFLSGVLVFVVFLPTFLFIRAKTSIRSLTISGTGISTRIGKIGGETSWKKVRVVVAGDSFVLIANKNGNAFFIPDRAFESPKDKIQFVHQAAEWVRLAG